MTINLQGPFRTVSEDGTQMAVTVDSVKLAGAIAARCQYVARVTYSYILPNGDREENHRVLTFDGPTTMGYPGPAYITADGWPTSERITSPERFGDTFDARWVVAYIVD